MTLIKALPKFTPLSEVKAIIISHAGLDASSVRILWTKSGSAVDKKATLKDICEPFGRVRLWQLRRNMPYVILCCIIVLYSKLSFVVLVLLLCLREFSLQFVDPICKRVWQGRNHADGHRGKSMRTLCKLAHTFRQMSRYCL